MAKEIGIIGAGAWGLALSKLLADKGEAITLWCHGEETYRELEQTRQRPAYLPGVSLPHAITLTRALEELAGKRLIIFATPSHVTRELAAAAAARIGRDTIVVCATKGLEEGTLRTMGEVLAEELGGEREPQLAFLSGPTFALEVARGLPAAITVAAYRDAVCKEIQETLSTQSFRVYTSADVTGVQMGGVVKNVIAIAAGISDGLGLGHNARAALVTRGLAEMTRLAARMGADPVTLAGLPGLGDLVLTCAGDLSRNRRVGLAIAAGKSLSEILETKGGIA
ncbi:MAG TPA: NAD(P)H-dependent glycerol-3-phosphate dehydrogenase, partial [Candidatus Eisenbacteria bacterium]|nr:NAD(P)H-dependent glycerol-3-phosphate dehydrogenase [Candidatus Eisenbacteria bacterium]